MRSIAILTAALVVSCGSSVLAADLPTAAPTASEEQKAPSPAPLPSSQFDGSVQSPPAKPTASPNPTLTDYPPCQTWSDGCRTCTRTDAGGMSCNPNIGTACQPGPDVCLSDR